MNDLQAIAALSALAHECRLRIFRLLIREHLAVSAGDIATRFDIAPSTLSFHLAHLERAGLIRSRRDQRRIMYSADIEGMRHLLHYLTADCCDGHPEVCADLLAAASSMDQRRPWQR